MERRTKEMTSIYAVKNPRTKQIKSRAVLNPRDSIVTAKDSLQTVGASLIFNKTSTKKEFGMAAIE